MSSPSRYKFKEVDAKWQNFWKSNNTFQVEKNSQKNGDLI